MPGGRSRRSLRASTSTLKRFHGGTPSARTRKGDARERLPRAGVYGHCPRAAPPPGGPGNASRRRHAQVRLCEYMGSLDTPILERAQAPPHCHQRTGACRWVITWRAHGRRLSGSTGSDGRATQPDKSKQYGDDPVAEFNEELEVRVAVCGACRSAVPMRAPPRACRLSARTFPSCLASLTAALFSRNLLTSATPFLAPQGCFRRETAGRRRVRWRRGCVCGSPC